MDRDFIILNGDTIVSDEIVGRLIAGASGSINVTVDVKPDYDSDDMKVHREGDRLISIGKRLPPGEANAESIGMLARSEEHTSELQSLMRSAYAVFRLKKKHQKTNTQRNT